MGAREVFDSFAMLGAVILGALAIYCRAPELVGLAGITCAALLYAGAALFFRQFV